MAQTTKCGIDTKALVAEEIHSGAKSIRFLAKMAPGFNPKELLNAGISIGAQAGQIVTLCVPVESLDVLESNREVLQYSISHHIAQAECTNTRIDTRTDSVQQGLGVIDSTPYNGEGVYIGITDWGFDYTHPNLTDVHSMTRIIRAWDHFRHAGPAPVGFDYGTEIVGMDKLSSAKCDTSNLYGYGTHGTHVAGICAGRGRNNNRQVGQAPKANLLLCSFGLGEAEWMDGVQWMRNVAEADGKRLVVNSSWGMYSFSTLDGTSLLSQAVDNWSDEGTIFCTSGGNNGNDRFHLSHTFRVDTIDTLRTVATYYTYASNAIGQALIMWGEAGHDFTALFRMKKGSEIWVSPQFNTSDGDQIIHDTLDCGDIRIPYRVLVEHANPFDNRPHIQLDVNRDLTLQLQLFVTAESGTVHAWNVANKENHAGNEGTPFEANYDGFTAGDNLYGIGEPACANKCISVAAHNADKWNSSHTTYTAGDLAQFSSSGPTLDGRQKPEISAPGVNVVSSISSFTTDQYSAYETYQNLNGTYIWSRMSGTSMSSPAVTGVVALMLQANPQISTERVRDIIFRNARNDSKTGPLVANDSTDLRWGWGKIDALRCVNEAIQRINIQTAEELRLPIHVYPNPATSHVSVNSNCGEQQTMNIFSIDGRMIFEMPISGEISIDVSNWQSGIYIIRIGSRTEKFFVK